MATTTVPKVKVRCSEIRVCGWSGERAITKSVRASSFHLGRTRIVVDVDPTERPCPKCLRRSVELVGRTNPNRF